MGGQQLQRVNSATNYNRSECTKHNVQLVFNNTKKNKNNSNSDYSVLTQLLTTPIRSAHTMCNKSMTTKRKNFTKTTIARATIIESSS